MTRGRDVRAAVACGADAIGFVFAAGSKRVIADQKARELVSQVPAFVTRVGLFLDQDEDYVRGILKQVPLSLLQFHGRENAEFCRQFGLPYIKAVSMGSGDTVHEMIEQAVRDFPEAIQDFGNLKQLVDGIFTPPNQPTRDKEICDPSPYATDLIFLAPKHKFMFVVEFIFSAPYQADFADADFAFVIKRTTRPSINFEYEDINYYNFRIGELLQ